MIYAPVLIPTCNRIDHLKRCVNSLRENTHAKKTTLLISLDYPPNEKYIEGNSSVRRYLEKGISGFANVRVYYQERNLGPAGNIDFLINEVSKISDRWIFTEDDNEFSPNFLDYMNKGLKKYKDDKKCFGICGFKYSESSFPKSTAYTIKYFQPYGYGMWNDRWKRFCDNKEKVILDSRNQKIFNIKKMYDYSPYLYKLFVNEILCKRRKVFWGEDKTLNKIDGVIQLYVFFEDLFCVFPNEYKSRTWGNDGTGYSMPEDKTTDPEIMWPLDQKKSFIYDLLDKPGEERIILNAKKRYIRQNREEMIKTFIKHVIYLSVRKSRKTK